MQQSLTPAGHKATDFTLQKGGTSFEQNEDTTINLYQVLEQKNVILAFYPADWSNVCSSQIALYNELLPTFKEYNTEIFGISCDGPFCHNAFKEQNNLSIELLCDFEPKGTVSKQYGAYNDQLGISERVLYVIDQSSIVRYSYLSPMGVNPGAKELLETIKNIQ